MYPRHGRIYAFEVDGGGGVDLRDDANVPSLLPIPYLGYRPANDTVYQNSRAFVLSPRTTPSTSEERPSPASGLTTEMRCMGRCRGP